MSDVHKSADGKRKMVKQNIEPVEAEEQMVIEDLTLFELSVRISDFQAAIEAKKAVTLTDAVRAAKKSYLGLTSQGIAMPVDVFVSSLTDLTDSERKTLSAELEGGLKPSTYAEYLYLDNIRRALLDLAKLCNHRGGKSSGKGDRKVKLSNFTCVCPICHEVLGNPEGCTQKHLIVNQMRLHMLNKHNVEKEQFNKEYRKQINDSTVATKDIIEEVR